MTYLVELVKTIRTTVVAEAEDDNDLDLKLMRGEFVARFDRATTQDTYLGSEYLSFREAKSPVICSEDDLKRALGWDDIGRALFKYTSCGICYYAEPRGIHVSGYAEDSGDAECADHFLPYPFEMDTFWTNVNDADREGCDLWDACHDEDGNEIDPEW